MPSVQELEHDHALLRKKLDLLEALLPVAPEARFILRELCFSLHRLLQEHLQRESPLLAFHSCTHAAAQQLLRAVNELLLLGMRASMPTVVVRLSHGIDQLRAQMDEQERVVFPELGLPDGAEASSNAPLIFSTMSVNEIIQRYPRTAPLFTQFHINRIREGYESVDELAWRHGMDVGQVIDRLRQAAFSGEP